MPEPNNAPLDERTARFRDSFQRAQSEIGKTIVGNSEIVEGVLICLLAGGHALLEGVPGLGKTLLVRTLSQVLDVSFSRIQFTPDLMPADISGTNILVEEEGQRFFRFQKGPVFAHIVLADEINRATPKTQSAMLEAMQEHSVTVAGMQHRLSEPFFVLATQNPIEMEGTYPLPEAQLDRFLFKLMVPSPTLNELTSIIERTTGATSAAVQKVLTADEILAMRELARGVPIAPHVMQYAAGLIVASHPDSPTAPDLVKQYVRCGSSPRGAQAIVLAAKIKALLAGRYNVAIDDINAVSLPALRHRILMDYTADGDGKTSANVVEKITETVGAAYKTSLAI
jgi:MoxR-like ATPase